LEGTSFPIIILCIYPSSLYPQFPPYIRATPPPLNPFSLSQPPKKQETHPCALQNFDSILKLANNKLVTVFLDYDGTLTPIVNNPDAAYLSEYTRDAVRQIATYFPTAIVSGRGREKVEQFVQLKELFYAGSHGMDISPPKSSLFNNNNTDSSAASLLASSSLSSEVESFQPAAAFAPLMNDVFNQLLENIHDIPGATVEHNKFCVSLHFRNCDAADYPRVVNATERVVAALNRQHSQQQQDGNDNGNDDAMKVEDDTTTNNNINNGTTIAPHIETEGKLRITRGRKVLEVRPRIDWDKGTALEHLLKMLGLSDPSKLFAIYIGDDRTDEDAFKVLKKSNLGGGILVSSRPKDTDSLWTLKGPPEVATFLHRLVMWGKTEGNGWHAVGGCTGWKLTGPPMMTSGSDGKQKAAPLPPLPTT
jgi:trehalose 6-phosphate phosphatase